MDPDVITQSLVSFFTTKEIGEGNGLGLCMAYGFMKQSNGLVVIMCKLDRSN